MSSTRAENERIIREACAAMPFEAVAVDRPGLGNQDGRRGGRLGLTDVVRAMKARPYADADFRNLINCWDLCKSDLHDQSDACLDTVVALLEKR